MNIYTYFSQYILPLVVFIVPVLSRRSPYACHPHDAHHKTLNTMQRFINTPLSQDTRNTHTVSPARFHTKSCGTTCCAARRHTKTRGTPYACHLHAATPRYAKHHALVILTPQIITRKHHAAYHQHAATAGHAELRQQIQH